MNPRIALYCRVLGVLGVSGLAAALAGCGLNVAEPTPSVPIEIKLDFCANDLPIWFATQTGFTPFEVVTPDAAGTFTFDATNRTGIAFVRQSGSDYETEIIFTTGSDLEEVSGVACLEESGTKQVNGTVAGVSGAELALVGMSFSSVYLTPQQTSFTLTQLADRPLDLIASRITVSGTEQNANRIIIRRTQNPTNGATMAQLNFDGTTEGVDPIASTATVGGVLTGDAPFLLNSFFSQLETAHTLTFMEPVANGTVPFVSIPAAELAAGDYHDLVVVAVSADNGVRGVERFFRNPANQTLTLSPFLASPTITTVATTPYVRLRAFLPGQTEYSSMVVIDYHQQTQFASTDVSLSVTASYFGGTPQTWDIQIPPFSGLAGWQDSWGLKPGPTDWTVTGYRGRPELVFGAKPDFGPNLLDTETVDFASRMSSVSPMQAYRSARTVARPRRFSR